MNKQKTVLVFCGLVATAFGQGFGGREIDYGYGSLESGFLDNNNIIASGARNVQFLGGDRLNANGNAQALNNVRSAATEQATSIDCGDKDFELELTCGGENQWACECNEGFVDVPR